MHGQSWCVMNHRKTLQGLVIFFTTLLTFGLIFHWLIPQAPPLMTKPKNGEKTFHYVAIGDSLTEGVGDSTKQGGFVPLVAQQLSNEMGLHVTSVNYGVSGNTSNQILKRMEDKKEIRENLKHADLMTLTVGGNDLRKVVMDHFLNLTKETFKTPAIEYSQRLNSIIRLARKENPDLPIYVVGIYNPFYLNFSELTEMQDIVDDWNTTTKEMVDRFDGVYFVPINSRIYKGIDGQKGITDENGDQTTIVNDALYEEDSFHPNNTGYEIMKQAIMEKIDATKQYWP